jgi:ankyrin repeat protein
MSISAVGIHGRRFSAAGLALCLVTLSACNPEAWCVRGVCSAGFGQQSLVSAAELGRVQEVRRLLAAGAESRKGSWTALTRATLFGQGEAVEILLDAGAQINAHESGVGSALYLAVAGRRDSLVERLLEVGADPNLTPDWGLTPLMVAAMQGNLPVVRLLLAHGADPKRRNPDGKTAVELALRERHPEVAAAIR